MSSLTLGFNLFLLLISLVSNTKCLSVSNFFKSSSDFGTHPDAHLSTQKTSNSNSKPQLVKKYGYPVETHYISTEDGHNLTVFRIPHGLRNRAGTKGPVFLQHGIISSSNDWLVNLPKNTLPYLLADEGYDVFIGNARGNSYSSSNVNRLNPKEDEYWNFSWHEMGFYDLPAVIDFILKTTGSDGLFYIGHSMGGTMFFVAMSERPEYNQKIKGMFGLAPGVFFGNTKSLMIKALGLSPFPIQTFLGQGQLNPLQVVDFVHMFRPTFCGGKMGAMGCSNLMYQFGGFNPEQIDSVQLSNIVEHGPSNASVRTLAHCIQLTKKPGQFTQYDWGNMRNINLYNSSVPPSYNLSRVTAPVYIYWAEADTLVDPQDVALLKAALWNVKLFTKINVPNFNHFDFMYGKDARTAVYDDVISNMNKISVGE